jgi:hypothetical protein
MVDHAKRQKQGQIEQNELQGKDLCFSQRREDRGDHRGIPAEARHQEIAGDDRIQFQGPVGGLEGLVRIEWGPSDRTSPPRTSLRPAVSGRCSHTRPRRSPRGRPERAPVPPRAGRPAGRRPSRGPARARSRRIPDGCDPGRGRGKGRCHRPAREARPCQGSRERPQPASESTRCPCACQVSEPLSRKAQQFQGTDHPNRPRFSPVHLPTPQWPFRWTAGDLDEGGQIVYHPVTPGRMRGSAEGSVRAGGGDEKNVAVSGSPGARRAGRVIRL